MYKYLFIFLFYTCSIAAPSSMANDKKLHILYTYGQGGEFGNILKEFGKNTGLTINAEFIAQGDLKSSIMKMLELQQSPDAIIFPADHLGLHDFIKYSEVNPSLFKAKIPQRIWDASMSDGKLYGAPLIQGNYLLLYYNKKFIKEPALDWEVMPRQKAQLAKQGIDLIAWPYIEPFYFLPFLGAFGGWPINDGKIELNTPAMSAALDFYKDLRTTKKLPNPECTNPCTLEQFKAQKVAYTISGEWEGKNFYQALGDNLGVSAIPKANGKKVVPIFSTHVIAFPENSLYGKKSASLIQLTNYLQSSKAQQQIWEKIGAIPVEATAFANAQKNAKEYLKQTLALMADTKPLPSDQVISFIWDALGKGCIRHWEGAMDSKQTAAYMQQLTERHVRNAAQATKLNQPQKP